MGEAQTSKRIQSALMSMTTNDRMVLMLRHFSECSYQEIAADTGTGRKDGEIAPVRGEAPIWPILLKDLAHELK